MAFQGRSVRLWKAILRLRLQLLMQLGLTAADGCWSTGLEPSLRDHRGRSESRWRRLAPNNRRPGG